MSDEYQLRKDIDRLMSNTYDLENGKSLIYTKSEVDDKLATGYYEKLEVDDIIDGKVKEIIDLIYPVGAIYMSVNTVNPSLLFGGEWEQIEDTFLLASGSTYSNGDTGGSADAVVVKHNHTQNSHSHTPSSDRSFMTAPSGSNWTELQGSNISGSGHHYVATSDTSNYNVYVQGSGSTTATNKETGVDGTNKNMPPYLTVNVWKRIG